MVTCVPKSLPLQAKGESKDDFMLKHSTAMWLQTIPSGSQYIVFVLQIL